MKFFWNLQLLEWKRALRKLPQILLGAVVLMVLVGTIAFCGQRLLYQDQVSGRITIAVAADGSSDYTELALSFLEHMETVASLCTFARTSEAEGLAMLEAREAAALLVVPGNMVEDIISGANTPVRVILPAGTPVSSSLVEEVTSAGAGTLGAAQAGIYGAYDLYTLRGWEADLPAAYGDLNRVYLEAALNRIGLFANETVSATGNLNVLEYYLATGLVCFLLLWGMTCGSFLEKDSPALARKLRIAGVGSGRRVQGKCLTAFLVMSIGILVMALAAAGIWMGFTGRWPGEALGRLPFLLPVCFCACALIVCLYQAAPTSGSGILLIFLVTAALLFLAGGFVPAAFLPQSFEVISCFLPVSWMLEGAGAFLTGAFSWQAAGVLLGFSVLLIGLGAWIAGREGAR